VIIRNLLSYFSLIFFLLPIAPSGQNQVSAGQLELNWTDNADNEEGFMIERKLNNEEFIQIVTVGANATSYIDTNLIDGAIYCYRLAAFNSSGVSPYAPEACAPAKPTIERVYGIGVFRPSTAEWYLDNNRNGVWDGCGVDTCTQFGNSGDLPVPGDYDGDGKRDLAIYQTSTGHWFFIGSTTGLGEHLAFGGPGYVPVPGDYDGDGQTDTAAYQTSTGNWFIAQSTAGFRVHPSFGGAGFEPVPGDYDGDGKMDVAVYQTETGHWFIVGSASGFMNHLAFGGFGYTPVPAVYDGDGKADIAVYNPASAGWWIMRSSDGGLTYKVFGGPSWMPVPADYDGDGKADIAVYDSNGLWSILRSSDGAQIAVGWGLAGDIPVPQL
jgi:hypothetical protein